MLFKLGTVRALLCFSLLILVVGCGEGAAKEAGQGEEASTHATEEHSGPEHELPEAPTKAFEPGRVVFVQVCSRCHIESEYAPTIGDTRDWKRRFARAENGIETLYDHAINGFGDMLAKGGKRGKDLTDEQVKQAVDYAVAVTQAEEPPAEQ